MKFEDNKKYNELVTKSMSNLEKSKELHNIILGMDNQIHALLSNLKSKDEMFEKIKEIRKRHSAIHASMTDNPISASNTQISLEGIEGFLDNVYNEEE